MRAIDAEYIKRSGSRVVRATIYSDGFPDTMPTTGENVDGLADEDVLDCGSVILDTKTGKVAMLGEDGDWAKWEE